MSEEFVIHTRRRVRRSVIDPDLEDLRWQGQVPADPLGHGSWGLFRDRISTRITTVATQRDQLKVTLRSGACHEDCELALSIVRRAAEAANGRVETIAGVLPVDQLNDVFDDTWKRAQIASAARIALQLVRDRGPMEMPGPTRSVLIGPRSAAELQEGDPSAMPDRLVALMRRVLWPDPRYESAGRFTATSPTGKKFTLAMLFPERPCVLPVTDRLAIEDAAGIFVIPRPALDELPVEATYLDDGNQTVEAIQMGSWPELCRVGRRYELPR
jgi:hypothetical protein